MIGCIFHVYYYNTFNQMGLIYFREKWCRSQLMPMVIKVHYIKALTATRWGKQKETLMATYKGMRPALEYASSVWSPIASSTSINKLQVMQHWELPQDAHKTQAYNICMTKHSHSPYTSTYSSTPHNTNRKHNIHHIPYTNTQHTSTLQG